MKRVIHIYFLALFCLTSCNGIAQKLSMPEAAASKFYNWYLERIYLKEGVVDPSVPSPILDKDSTYFIDTVAYNIAIRKTGFFSEKFLQTQDKIFATCNKELHKFTNKDIEKCNCYVAELAENECKCLQSKPWVNGQGEELATAVIDSSKTNITTSTVFLSLKDAEKKTYSLVKMILVKENSAWKIIDIEPYFQ